MAGNVMPLEENVGDMNILKAVELVTRYVCHRVPEWTDRDDMVQLAVAALSVYQLRSIYIIHSFGFWKVTRTCGRTME